jgi:hypothetical protein
LDWSFWRLIGAVSDVVGDFERHCGLNLMRRE